ncbi:hypothetical protein PISL3812_07722 [Talaromyces islandicus]|uniref:Uncharacterized protein n=1 Tax=Talaromyces islandicus TaxID=28573 RepID=A0A0U1M554_TALIS|nr:hypothetical protein PISL3812_07722 [Talaromyces islandicus]
MDILRWLFRPQDNEPRCPPIELGNFKIFWEDFKVLRSKYKDTDPESVASREETLAKMFVLYDEVHGNSHLLGIGEKIDTILSSVKGSEVLIEDIFFILDLRCSLQSHPYWDWGHGSTKNPEQVQEELPLDVRSSMTSNTTVVLNWFLTEFDTDMAGHVPPPENIRFWIQLCKGIMATNDLVYALRNLEIEGSEIRGRWDSVERPSFDEWVTFLHRERMEPICEKYTASMCALEWPL